MQHRETQGNESALFMGYFKPAVKYQVRIDYALYLANTLYTTRDIRSQYVFNIEPGTIFRA